MARYVRVVSIALQHRRAPTVEENRHYVHRLMKQAAAEQPDIVVLPETFTLVGVPYASVAEVAEPIPGPTTELMADYARKHHTYVICPLIGVHGTKYHNDAVLLDRSGDIVGVYSKLHPVVQGSEFTNLELGITPGEDTPVFETDFGRIGLQICFDITYPDGWATLKEQGAEIVFWCSAYDGGRHLEHLAWQHHYFIVSAVQSRYARVVNIMGETVARGNRFDPVLTTTLDLDIALFHCDFNASVIPEIRRRHGSDVIIRVWDEESFFTLQTRRADLHVADLVEEFNLEPLDRYLARNQALQDAIRTGKPIPDLTPPYLGRTQWV